MNTPQALVRSSLLMLIIGLFTSVGTLAQVGALGPVGTEPTGPASNSGPLMTITDSPDPFGMRYGSMPRQTRYVLWGSPTAPGNPGTRFRPLPTVLLIDPATGAVVGVEAEGTGQRAIRPGMVYLGADGYIRLVLPARPQRHR